MRKNYLKSLLMIVAMVAMMIALTFPLTARAGGTGSASFGVTNGVIAAATTNTTLGVSNVSVDQRDSCDVVFSFSTEAACVDTFTLQLARVDVNGNVETAPRFLLPFVAGSSTTNFYLRTNIPSSTIGAASALSLIAIRSPTSNKILTNPVVTLEFKRLQAPN